MCRGTRFLANCMARHRGIERHTYSRFAIRVIAKSCWTLRSKPSTGCLASISKIGEGNFQTGYVCINCAGICFIMARHSGIISQAPSATSSSL